MAILIIIVFSCMFFTNAIEFLGNKLKLGNNATGSILAVIGTGLPELVIPLVAIFGANFSDVKIETACEIALGAIIGSPFMLSTLALFLLVFVLMVQKRKRLYVDCNAILRNYKYFILSYFIAVLFSFKFLNDYKSFAVLLLITIYCFFVYRTIVKSRCVCIECENDGLYLKIKNENLALFLQLTLSLFALILSSHFFVDEIKYFSTVLNISPAILALVVTPFATELPECVNSLIWLKQGKDDLALANILGAVVYQATILFSIGIILTPWIFDNILIANIFLTFLGAIILSLGLMKNKKITLANLLFCGIIYFAYLVYIFIK